MRLAPFMADLLELAFSLNHVKLFLSTANKCTI